MDWMLFLLLNQQCQNTEGYNNNKTTVLRPFVQYPLHIPYISSPNQCLFLATHGHTTTASFAEEYKCVSIGQMLFMSEKRKRKSRRFTQNKVYCEGAYHLLQCCESDMVFDESFFTLSIAFVL